MEIIDPKGDLVIALKPTLESFAPWNAPTVNEAEEVVAVPLTEFLVSSKHLCLAATRYCKILEGDRLKAKIASPNGRRHVIMMGYYEEAFRIVMNVIHGKNRNIPSSTTVDMLGMIAVIADDLGCQDSLLLAIKNWMGQLRLPTQKDDVLYDGLLRTYRTNLDLGCGRCRTDLDLTHDDRDLAILIFVSYVFRLGEPFYGITRLAILHMPGDISTHGLPIPEKITVTLKFMIYFSQDLSLTM